MCFRDKIQQRSLIVSYGLVINRPHKSGVPTGLVCALGGGAEVKLQEKTRRGLGDDPRGQVCTVKSPNARMSQGRYGRYWGVCGHMLGVLGMGFPKVLSFE